VVRELGGIMVQGKAEPAEAFVLLGLLQASAERDAPKEYGTPGAFGASVDRPASA
jgi:hypothetical protein